MLRALEVYGAVYGLTLLGLFLTRHQEFQPLRTTKFRGEFYIEHWIGGDWKLIERRTHKVVATAPTEAGIEKALGQFR
jgi:hypothetical protein